MVEGCPEATNVEDPRRALCGTSQPGGTRVPRRRQLPTDLLRAAPARQRADRRISAGSSSKPPRAPSPSPPRRSPAWIGEDQHERRTPNLLTAAQSYQHERLNPEPLDSSPVISTPCASAAGACGGPRRPPKHTPAAGRRVQDPGSSKRWLGGPWLGTAKGFCDGGAVWPTRPHERLALDVQRIHSLELCTRRDRIRPGPTYNQPIACSAKEAAEA
jgi:hypothetical protein